MSTVAIECPFCRALFLGLHPPICPKCHSTLLFLNEEEDE